MNVRTLRYALSCALVGGLAAAQTPYNIVKEPWKPFDGAASSTIQPFSASLSNGNFVVCAYTNDVTIDGDLRAAMCTILDASGTTVVAPWCANCDGSGPTTNYQVIPMPVGLTTGEFVVVYEDYSTTPITVKGMRYSNAGVAQGSTFTVHSAAINTNLWTVVALDSGKWAVLLRQQMTSPCNYIVVKLKIFTGGTASTADIAVDASVKYQSNPTATLLTTGNLNVCWHSYEGGCSTDPVKNEVRGVHASRKLCHWIPIADYERQRIRADSCRACGRRVCVHLARQRAPLPHVLRRVQAWDWVGAGADAADYQLGCRKLQCGYGPGGQQWVPGRLVRKLRAACARLRRQRRPAVAGAARNVCGVLSVLHQSDQTHRRLRRRHLVVVGQQRVNDPDQQRRAPRRDARSRRPSRRLSRRPCRRPCRLRHHRRLCRRSKSRLRRRTRFPGRRSPSHTSGTRR